MSIDLEFDNLNSSYLITYSTPEEKEEILEQLEACVNGLKRKNLDGLETFSPKVGVVDCIDISNQKQILLDQTDGRKKMMGWVKAGKIIILCKRWQWDLLNSKGGRWINHLQTVYHSTEPQITEDAILNLVSDESISNIQNRRIIYDYLKEQELFEEFLESKGIDSGKVQRVIDKKELWEISESEMSLLLRPNNELFRYLTARGIREQQKSRFARQEFVELFGEIPHQIQSNSEVFGDILAEINAKESNIEQLARIDILAGILHLDGFESKLGSSIKDILKEDPDKVFNRIKKVDQGQYLQRATYIADFLESESTESIYSALLTVVALGKMSGEGVPLDIIERYQDVASEDKKLVTRLLVEKIDSESPLATKNYKVIADFLKEDGPKVVLLLDGLPLTNSETIDFLSEKEKDQRWEVKQATTPIPSVTEKFRSSLSTELDFSDLGGFTQGEDLTGLEFDAFLGEEKEDELFNILQNGDSVIIYNADIDQATHFNTDMHRKIDAHLKQNIPDFVRKYGDHADILITSDHGLVETYESEAISRPDEADQRGIGHFRGTFIDEENISSVSDKLGDNMVSYIEVGLPNDNECCLMVNPNNPNAKFGTQNSDLWIHGGVSIEESIVPVAIWRRE